MLRPAILALAVLFAGPALAAEHDLVVAKGPGHAITINGTTPGPTLRLREGEDAVIRVTNRLGEETSVHWHGLILPGHQDGTPGMNGYPGIKPGETFTYRFPVRQNGTYWYHAHSATQEQAGHYGAIVIEPAIAPAVKADRDHVVLLSEATSEDPDRLLRNLKVDPGYYNFSKRTLSELARDARKFGLGRTLKDRFAWGRMRMDPTDIADTGGYRFLANGRAPSGRETLLFKPGETVKLRIVNGSAMTFFDLRVPGLKLTVVATDGRPVQPVEVDELRIGAAEAYDVLVRPTEDRAYAVFAESIDRSGNALAVLAPREGMSVAIPAMRARAILTMGEMGHVAGGNAHAGHARIAAAAGDPHAGHGAEPAASPVTHDHHHAAHAAATPLPRVAYGMGAASSLGHAGHAELGAEGETDGSGRPFGWASGAPRGSRVLSYADLKAAAPHADARAPTREITVRLTGNMERYLWTLDGKTFEEAEPLKLAYGERVRVRFVNETMMAHPMHLHGMFMQLENGAPLNRLPEKTVVSVAPGRTASVIITADQPGEWAFHCHLLYHMASGMMQKLVVATADGPATPPPAAPDPHHRHAGHGASH